MATAQTPAEGRLRQPPVTPLRRWLTLLVLGTAVPLLAFAVFVLVWLVGSYRADQDRRQADTTRALALAVDAEIRSWTAALQALAGSHELQAGRLADFYAEAQAVAARYDGWIVLTEASGQQVLNTRRAFGDPLPKAGTPETVQTVFRTRQPLVTNLFFGAVAQRHVLAVMVPVQWDEQVRYTLDMSFGPERLTRLLAAHQFPSTWVSAIIDGQQKVVARMPESLARQGQPVLPALARAFAAQASGTLESTTTEGQVGRIAFQRLREAPWSVNVMVPAPELQAAWRRPLLAFLLLGGLAACGAVALAIGLARKIARPVTEAARVAGAVVHGEAPALPSSPIAEVAALQQALAVGAASVRTATQAREQALTSLQEANAGLEARVAERTATLDARTHQLEAVRAITAEITGELRLPEVLDLLTRPAVTLLGGMAGDVYLWQDETQELVPVAWVNEGDYMQNVRVRLGEHLAGRVAAQRQGLIVNDYQTRPEANPLVRAEGKVAAAVMEPLLYRDRLVGVITVDRDAASGPFTPEDQQALQLLAGHAAVAIENARLYDAAQRELAERVRTEATLRQSETKFATAFQTSPIGITLSAVADGRYLDVNAAFLTMVGYTRAELLGRTSVELGVWSDAALRARTFADLHAAGTIREREITFRRKSGETFPCLFSCELVEINGQPVALTNMLDITARTQATAALRNAHDELEAVFAGIGDAVVVYDPNGTPVKANQAAVATLGFDPVGVDRSARLQRIALHHVDGRPVPVEEMPTRRVERGETFSEQPYRLTGADGQTRIIHCAGAPLHRDGRLWGMVLSWHDVTDRETLVQQLQEQQLVLEQRVHERTADLAQKAAQLQALTTELTLAEQRERQRLAELLHDGLQQLLVGAKFKLTLLPRMDPSRIAAWAREMDQLLDEAVAASRTLTGELSPPILQTGGLLAGLEWLVRYKAERYQLAVALDADPEAIPDSEAMTLLLFQSVRELLFNIVKHAQVRAARVEVRRQDGHLQIIVSDHGVGFDPATMSASSPRGLGLASIRQRLEYLGGCVGITSAPGEGCRITLAAPLRSQVITPSTPVTLTPADGRAAPSARRGQKTRILLVDDHAVVRQALAQMLRAEPDLEVIGEAADGKAGVERTKELAPDVVLMDISMPGMNGIEATQQIHAECSGVQVIGLSMFGAPEQTAAMQQAGAAGYVSKSAPAEELLAAIRTCAGRTSSQP